MDLKDLYRDVILDHNKNPRNFGKLEPCDTSADGHNPLCGDRLTLTLRLDGDTVSDVRFEGKGCAISTASASLMTEAIKGLDERAITALSDVIHRTLTSSTDAPGVIWPATRAISASSRLVSCQPHSYASRASIDMPRYRRRASA